MNTNPHPPPDSLAAAQGSELLTRLYNHRATMDPHQKERHTGKLLMECIAEIERLNDAIRLTLDKEIEKLRDVAGSGKIDPKRKYRLDIGNGQIMEYTGAELIETAEATVAFADAEKRGDKVAMMAAMKRMGMA